MIQIEICYALSEKQWLKSLAVPSDTTVIRAIMLSGILDDFPEISLENNVGIFSKKVSLDSVLSDGDRIEIYRPLILTPNQLRLLRVKS